MMFEFKSLFDLQSAFPDEQSCIDHLENMIWGDVIISPFDATSKVYKCKGNKYRCKNTGKYFNVKTGTLFDNTKIELRKWFMAIWLVTSHKKGISSVQLSKDIGVTQKTAWFMLERIRKCFSSENNNSLDDVVEVDETYIGGKNKNRHNSKKVKNAQGRSLKDKSAVVGMVQRQGKVNAHHVPDTKTKRKQLNFTQMNGWVIIKWLRCIIMTLLIMELVSMCKVMFIPTRLKAFGLD